MRSCNHALGEKMAGRLGWAVREWFKYKNKLGDRMIKQLSNSVIAKYCDLSMSRRSIICLSLRLRQIIDLLATDKSQYFAQPRPIIVNYICWARRSSKVTSITVIVSIVARKQASWLPLFITFLISPCLVTTTYQVSSEIYGGFFYQGITLIYSSLLSIELCMEYKENIC